MMINPNDAFEDEIYFEYLKNPESVSAEWRKYFEETRGDHPLTTLRSSVATVEKKTNGHKPHSEEIHLNEGDFLEPLGTIQTKISENMEKSLEVPTATSIRTMPVKALDENRRIINKYLLKLKRRKVSFTHMLAWALAKTLQKFPHMNDAFSFKDGKPYRVKRKSINIGLAIDITKKDGRRLLLVPNVKNTQDMTFNEFIRAFDEIINKTRENRIELDDLAGTTVTLTNPGMIGTSASSPRLMNGQGLIVATGAIDYPAEFQAVRPEVLTTLAVSKVVTMTNTYDHRILQGAESAEFLDYMNKLLIGENKFYDQIFASLGIPFEPIRWSHDNTIVNRFGQVDQKEVIEKGAHVMLMINAYRVRGHLLASVNPLGYESYYYPELDPAYYGFTIWDLDRIFHAEDAWEKNELPLRSIIEILRETYCGPIGVEFMHIQDPNRKNWVKNTLEADKNSKEYDKEDKFHIFRKLIEAEEFEDFLHTKFVGHKRFSLEGSESVIVMLDKLLELAADNDMKHVFLGMAHRGRLNVLVNNIGKDIERIFNEFDGNLDLTSYQGSGDVKYHLGSKGTFTSRNGKSVPVFLASNPSHLELVNPVVVGMARAGSNDIGDESHTRVLPVLIHGDAAFAGQGIVSETLNLSKLHGYETGGTINIIINNQIGFTTTIEDARSTIYASDVSKMIQVPIIHVNGNDPEAVATAISFAFEYRQKFNDDVIIDMLCYRKYGHNEADEPRYTQPLLYKKINSMSPVGKIYEKILSTEAILSHDEAVSMRRDVQQHYYDKFARRKNQQGKELYRYVRKPELMFDKYDTAITEQALNRITEAITSLPPSDTFTPNPKVKKLLEKRAQMVKSEKPAIDWAMGEALAFGSILIDNREIRFSGEDVRRGTFSQRHALVVDIITEEEYIPLNHIREGQSNLRIFDSPLSELAVLGYEYGYSVIADESLTLWEAQFGDFANMGQPIVDQFISCSESKWGQTSNLVMLLPHSYDGQGPEHSSARHERFLQLAAEDNMIVCNLTTPAQYFHVLRRQMAMKLRKPLIIMTPKSMLRHHKAVSSVEEFTNGHFREIIGDEFINEPDKVKRVILCNGKFYYDLLEKREKSDRNDVAIIRVEQQYPLHASLLKESVEIYKSAKELIWAQEEPQNMGVWSYIFPRLMSIFGDEYKIKYVGRESSASTATGSFKKHMEEQERILGMAFAKLF